MIKEVTLPEISENVSSGEVIQILVKVGDFIKEEQALVQLETEKASFDVPSPVKGKVVEVAIKEGQEVQVGQVLLKVDTEADPSKEEAKPAEKPKPKEPEKPAEEKKEEPKQEKKEEAAAEEPSSPEPAEEAQEPEPVKPAAEEPGDRKAQVSADAVPAAPSVRQLARELGVDITRIKGSGPGGRLSADDVKQYAKGIISGKPAASQAAPVEARPLPDFSKWGKIEREKVSVTRRKIAETLSYTWSHIPQVTQYDQADVTALEQFRKEYGPAVEKAGGKLTVTSILLKVAALALKEFPKFNATFDPEANEIIYKKYYHISVAVDTDRGLLVPVIRDADQKSILRLSVELTELAQKTRDRKVSPDEMMGGNFTLSNLGGIGGTYFAPILYWPQAAILGIARAVQQPRYIDGQLQMRMILPLSLSYDHRIIDGAEGARFIRWIAKRLENPFLTALQEKTD